ncbi:MAG: hypothetical protein A4E53_02656 [Pelotomaculum sp. PtaB.Bin104]|nr:MAG: hypothetical protein A4E53_02656 [Pelotomaculum sp. PtaB.Bin104]
MKNQQILVESKTARQQMIQKISVLDMLGKPVPVLTKDGRSTIKQIAEFYEVHLDAIVSILRRNKDEFSVDGITVISAKEYKKLDIIDCQVDSLKLPRNSITLLPKQAILRIGMLLTESKLATKLRDTLVKGEQEMTYKQKTRAIREAEKWEAQREAGKMVRKSFADTIELYIPESPNKKWKYKQFTDLIYKNLFGQVAKELRLSRGASDNDSLRDGFSVDELNAVGRAETFVSGLIMSGDSYDTIKTKIKFVNFWAKPAKTA